MDRKPIVTENAIKGFFGEYRFLSNFQLAPVVYDGDIYPSTEHAFQAAKFDKDKRNPFTVGPSVGSNIGPITFAPITCRVAKQLGGKATIDRSVWEAKKIGVMYEVVLAKFLGHPDLRAKLLATEWKKLVELNDWGDRFWGAEMDGDKEVGFNMLGNVLEAVRARMVEFDFNVKGLADIRRVRGIQHGEQP